MKATASLSVFVVLLVVLGCLPLCAQPGAVVSPYTNDLRGREFWVAVPLNNQGSYPGRELEFFVTSEYNTRVTLEYPGSGFTVTKPVQAGKTTVLTTADGSASWNWEVHESETVERKGIRITSEHPIVVHVLNAKQVSSDGYAALPVDVWGTEYLHLGYYDFGEFSQTPWGGGFIVVASENNTTVQIKLDGVNTAGVTGSTVHGKTLGSTISVQLNRGDVYAVRGNGLSLGQFDLSGTRIVSSKPVGVISFHQRAMIPAFPAPNNGRDHLSEMLPPVSAWGTEHVTMEIDRGTNRGDFFRIIAAEDNTTFTCTYTDLVTGATRVWEGLLEKAGDFAEKENSWPPGESIRGVAVWRSSKPTLLMQYSYSAYWDGSTTGVDPFMVTVAPAEQYVYSAEVQTPADGEFTTNSIHLIAVGDTSDPQATLLKSLTLNGQPIHESFPQLLANRIGTTKYYWVRLAVPPGVYTIAGDTKFSALMYGVNLFQSYAWPAAAAFNRLDIHDTLSPVLTTAGGCGRFTITAVERRDQPASGGQPSQTDAGIHRIELDPTVSRNFAIRYVTNTVTAVAVEPRREEFVVELSVLDPAQDAFARVYVIDAAGNVAVGSISYQKQGVIRMVPSQVYFGENTVGSTATVSVTLENIGSTAATVTALSVAHGGVFTPMVTLPITLVAGESREIDVRYDPSAAAAPFAEHEDTLMMETASGCTTALASLRGKGVDYLIVGSTNIDMGTVPVGSVKCTTVTISNPMSVDVELTVEVEPEVEPVEHVFSVTAPSTLAAGATTTLTLCFEPVNTDLSVAFVMVTYEVEGLTTGSRTIVVSGDGSLPASSVMQTAESRLVDILPNPAVDAVQVRYHLSVAGSVKVELYTAEGRLVRILDSGYREAGEHRTFIRTEQLSSGLYLCRLTTDNGVYVQPVSVVR